MTMPDAPFTDAERAACATLAERYAPELRRQFGREPDEYDALVVRALRHAATALTPVSDTLLDLLAMEIAARYACTCPEHHEEYEPTHIASCPAPQAVAEIRQSLARLTAPALTAERLALTPVDQVDGDGMCLAACISSLTDIPFSAWPPLAPEIAAPDFWDRIYGTLNAHGWEIARTGRAPIGYAIADGDGPRGVRHSVVVRDGVLVHDPHPSRAGLGLTGLAVCHWIPVRAALARPSSRGRR